MDCALRMTPSSICSLPKDSLFNYYCHIHTKPKFIAKKLYRIHTSDAVSRSYSSSSARAIARAVGDVHGRSSLKSLFCYDKPIPDEIIEKRIGLSLSEINVGNNPHCPSCQAKGAVLLYHLIWFRLICGLYLGESRNHCESSLSR